MQANNASSAKHISFRIVLAASVCSATDRKKGACKALWQAVCIEGSLALIRHSHFNYALVISLCRGEDVMLTQPSHCSQMGRLSVSVPKKRGHLACRSEFWWIQHLNTNCHCEDCKISTPCDSCSKEAHCFVFLCLIFLFLSHLTNPPLHLYSMNLTDNIYGWRE